MGTFMGRLRDPVAGRLRDVGHICFLNSTENILNLLWQDTQVNCDSEKISEQYSNLNKKYQMIKK